MTQLQITDSVRTVQTYFDANASDWDRHSKPDYEKINMILQMIDMQPDKHILDVACGTGVLFPALLQYRPRIIRAIDVSSEMVRIAAEKHSDHRLRISAMDFYSFEECGFDYLMVYNAYPHFLNKEKFAKRASACLNPGGRIVIAHNSGRVNINNRHAGKHVQIVSAPLKPIQEEIQDLKSHFTFDIMVDTEHVYILSGRICTQHI